MVGAHVAERLLADGWAVRALSRCPDAARAALDPGIEVVHGDVLDAASFSRAAVGTNVVFHAAANIIVRGGWQAYRHTNIEGTRNAIAAAEHARARLLHVSSVAVYGAAARYEALERGERTDEATPFAPLPERAYYARSKRESEELVLRAHGEGRVWATAIRPDVIYGTRDRQFVPRMAAMLMKRVPVPLLRGGRSIMSVVQAENVADGAVLAATTDGAGGQAYNLANDFDVSVRQFFTLAGEGLGRRTLFVPMPLWAAHGALRASKWLVRMASRGRFHIISSSAIDFISRDNPFSSEKAVRELGWRPRVRPEVGIPRAFRWWLETQRARR